MRYLLFVILAVVVVALAEAAYYFASYMAEHKQEELKRRLRLVGHEHAAGPGILRSRRLAKSAWLNDALAGLEPLKKFERLLEQTDIEMSVAQLCGWMVGLFATGALLAFYLAMPVFAPVLALAFGALPLVFVFSARTKRAQRISEQLPDALDMMARSIKAGHALPSTLKLVAQECPSPVAVEFARAFEQQNLGLSFDQAVMNMTQRVPSCLDLRLFAVSVVIQKETGGNIVELLDNIAATIRERFKFYSKLRALTAEGKMSGIILGAMPFGVAFMVMLTNPQYIGELKEGLGRMILVGGISSWCVGVVWMRSLMKVDY